MKYFNKVFLAVFYKRQFIMVLHAFHQLYNPIFLNLLSHQNVYTFKSFNPSLKKKKMYLDVIKQIVYLRYRDLYISKRPLQYLKYVYDTTMNDRYELVYKVSLVNIEHTHTRDSNKFD